jgi:hypothetical protein
MLVVSATQTLWTTGVDVPSAPNSYPLNCGYTWS